MYDLYNSNKYLNMDSMYKKFTSQVKKHLYGELEKSIQKTNYN